MHMRCVCYCSVQSYQSGTCFGGGMLCSGVFHDKYVGVVGWAAVEGGWVGVVCDCIVGSLSRCGCLPVASGTVMVPWRVGSG